MTEIVLFPDQRLSKACSDVSSFDDRLIDTLCNMLKVMRTEGGIGIAANQAGYDQRIILMRVEKHPYVLEVINPIIHSVSPVETIDLEGCLSFPGIRLLIQRPKTIELEYSTMKNERKFVSFTDIEARCLQHEIDHLNGQTFLARANEQQRAYAMRELEMIKVHKQQR